MYNLIKQLAFLLNGIFLCFLIIYSGVVNAQNNKVFTLRNAYEATEKNYPLLRQKGLIKETESLNIQNLQSGYLPQFTINGHASFQSAVTQLNLPLPGVKMEQLSKDQYRILGDVSQLLWDGGVINSQKQIQQLNTIVDEAKVDFDLYQVKNRTVQIYFTILYQDELLKETALHLANIKLGINKVEAQVTNGIVLKSNLLVLQAQLLQANQRVSEIKNTRKGLIEALSLLSGQNLSEDVLLEQPALINNRDTIKRPELYLFNKQEAQLEEQKKLINAGNRPKVSAFFQGGYGRPGLNMLSNEFDLFYLTGIRLNWSLGRLYNSKRDKRLAEVGKETIGVQRETFLLNTNTQLAQQRAEIEKYKALIAEDKAIVDIRQLITQSAKAQLENSVITANDYLREVNAEDAIRQTLITHKLQLLQAHINYQIISGAL